MRNQCVSEELITFLRQDICIYMLYNIVSCAYTNIKYSNILVYQKYIDENFKILNNLKHWS